jgi:hypothetical protein
MVLQACRCTVVSTMGAKADRRPRDTQPRSRTSSALWRERDSGIREVRITAAVSISKTSAYGAIVGGLASIAG